MKKFQELDFVVLTHDLPEQNLKAGDGGTIVHIHDDSHFMVEFVEAAGTTRALLHLSSDDVRPVTSGDMIAVRPT
jgi:hypothetical protein